jgi:hypothetical protein
MILVLNSSLPLNNWKLRINIVTIRWIWDIIKTRWAIEENWRLELNKSLILWRDKSVQQKNKNP